MNALDDWLDLYRERRKFLEKGGHRLSGPTGLGFSLVSALGGGQRFRWVLVAAAGTTRPLGKEEREEPAFQKRRASKRRQSLFLVLRLEKPMKKLLVVPAERTLRLGRISSHKGGIPSDE